MKTTGIISKTVMYIIIAITMLFAIMSWVESAPMAEGSWTGTIVWWTVGILALGAVLAAVSGAVGAIADPSSLPVTLGALLGFAALIAFFYFGLADGTEMNLVGYDGDENTEGWLKLADTSLFTCYTLLGLSVLAIIVSEVVAFFK